MVSPPLVVDLLAHLPVVATSGSCAAFDRRPKFNLIYFLAPLTATTASFWVLNVLTGALQALPPPNLTANSVIGAGTTMCYDESLGRVWLYNAQSTTAAGFEWASWQYYDTTTAVWTQRNVLSLGLLAQWQTDAALVHTDGDICVGRPMAGQAADNYIYLCGNAATPLYRYSIVADTWTALLGGGGVRGGAPGAGSNLIWNEWNNDQLLSWRGGGSTLLDVYTISTDTWAAGVDPNPPLVCDTGFESASMHAHGSTSLLASGGVLYMFDHTSNRILPLATIYGQDGTAHLGNALFYYSVGVATDLYAGIRVHSSDQVQRVRMDI